MPAAPIKIIIVFYVPSELQLLFNDAPNDVNLLKIDLNYKFPPNVDTNQQRWLRGMKGE